MKDNPTALKKDFLALNHSVERAIALIQLSAIVSFLLAIAMLVYSKALVPLGYNTDNTSSGSVAMIVFAILYAIFGLVLTHSKRSSTKLPTFIIAAIVNLPMCIMILPIVVEVFIILAIVRCSQCKKSFIVFDSTKDKDIIEKVRLDRERIAKRYLLIPMLIILPLITFSIGNTAGMYSGWESKNKSVKKNIEKEVEEKGMQAAINGLKMGYSRGYEDGKNCVSKRVQEILTYGNSNMGDYDCYDKEFK